MRPVELRLIVGRIPVVWHNEATLEATLARVPPGQWLSLWPGILDEQVMYACECGRTNAHHIAVQLRRA